MQCALLFKEFLTLGEILRFELSEFAMIEFHNHLEHLPYQLPTFISMGIPSFLAILRHLNG
jgi:hypothetical protein